MEKVTLLMSSIFKQETKPHYSMYFHEAWDSLCGKLIYRD